jgi:hypothetical protein
MVGKAAEACPTLLSPGSAPLSELRELAETKAAARLPPDFAKNLVAATLGVELTNKVRFHKRYRGSMTFWYGSGSADLCLSQMDPDSTIFVIDL